MNIKSMDELDLHDLRVLIREDLNVPLDEEGHITSEARIQAALPTIRLALKQNARVMILSHLGRPEEGQETPTFSLKPVAERLSALLDKEVLLKKDYLNGIDVEPGQVVLLENVRFLKGEKKNDEALSKQLARLCDVFVMDAFAVAHRAQASTVGVASFAPTVCCGPLMQKELTALTQALKAPKRPLLAIIGGSKVSTKITVLESLLDKVDCLVVGGGMANTLLKAQGHSIGASLVEEEWVSEAKKFLDKVQQQGKTVILPVDVRVAQDKSQPAAIKTLDAIQPQDIIFDIGPNTAEQIAHVAHNAQTIVWNGPLGVFEMPAFAEGTKAVAKAIASSKAFSLAGGGDTLAAIEQAGIKEGISYESTAGGAFLEFLEGRTLPGVEILEKRSQEALETATKG